MDNKNFYIDIVIENEKICNQILFRTINSLQYLAYISVEEF